MSYINQKRFFEDSNKNERKIQLKRTKLLTILGGICLVLILAVLPFMAACAAPAPAPTPTPTPMPTPTPLPPAEPYVIKSVSIFSPPHASLKAYFDLIDRVNERANGELIINHIGGPEVMPMFDQAIAVKRGVIEMAFVWHGAYAGIVPEAEVVYASRLTLAEERERGVIDLLREIHAKGGFFYLGRPRDYDPEGLFFIWTKKRVEKPQDLAGMKIGMNSATTNPFTKALGAVPAVIGSTELYASLERGVVDSFMTARSTFVAFGMQELVNYVIDHGYYNDGLAFLINLEYWNALPQHLQKLVEEVHMEVQQDALVDYLEVVAKNKQAELDAGVEFIKFSPADAEWYIETAYSTYWENVIKKYGDLGQRFFELMEE